MAAKAKRRVKKINYNIKKQKLINLLEARGDFEETDLVIIDRMYMLIELSDMAFQDIRDRGIVVNVASPGKPEVFQKNPNISTLTESNKEILASSKRLALSARDRFDLGIATDKPTGDGF